MSYLPRYWLCLGWSQTTLHEHVSFSQRYAADIVAGERETPYVDSLEDAPEGDAHDGR